MSKTALGEFEHLVLMSLLHLGDEAYAVAVVDDIRERTGREAARAAVYIALRRLERRGLVSSHLGEPTPERGGRPKRFFAVEPDGIAAVRTSRRALDQMWAGLEPLLEED